MATTTIQVDEETAEELHDRKRRGETYDDVICRLLEGLEVQPEPAAPADPAPVDVDAREPAQAAGVREVDELDLQGQGKILERRRDAVTAVVDRIGELGRASKGELLEIVDPEALGYHDGESAWKNLLQPALHDLELVEATGPSGAWVPAEDE